MAAIQMTSSRSLSAVGPEFNAFLHAPVWDESDEMSLSVLSALARLDLDAWAEASQLARLPGNTAVQRLASLIARLPAGPSGKLDANTIAVRLIALLPQPPAGATARVASAGVETPKRFGAGYLILMATILGIQWIIASHFATEQTAADRAPASNAALQQRSLTASAK